MFKNSPGVRRRTRSIAVVGVAFALGAGLLSACGDDANDTEPAPAGADGAVYPVTIEHALGTTTIDSKPERIVALWDGDIDALLALGIVPIGITEAADPGGITSWAKPKLGGETPTLIPVGENGVDPEAVAALDPDVIFAGSDYYIDNEYEALSQIAPTTAYETGPFEDPWQTTLRQVGKALGLDDEAEKIITDTETEIAAVREKNPSLDGTEYALANIWESGSIGVLRSDTDAGVRMLSDFGLVLDPDVVALEGDEYAVQVSLERLDVLDTGLFMAYFGEDALRTELTANPLFQGLDVVKRGSFVDLSDEHFSALRTPTVLSVDYIVDNVVPIMAEAAAKTP